MKAQGWNLEDNVLAQDNKSSILLENNGKASSSKRTKQINVHYFFITDGIVKGELCVEWCPTLDMVGDYMTKPLQGALFCKFCDLIMGHKHASMKTKDSKEAKPSLALPVKKKGYHRSVLDKKVCSTECKKTENSLGRVTTVTE
jgi:hypothetical protein